MTVNNNVALRRWRGLALELIYESFRNHGRAIDHVMLWGMMQQLGQDLGGFDVIFVLRQMKDRRYIEYVESRNRLTNEVSLSQLKITPAGCDLVEKSAEDPAILLL
jgi:hypothetical protein